ncbi:uncharacterized protein PFL1_03208 [Pseudozyma flocculosa PF-1]|uniref:G protein-coupled receptor 89 n=2 Tax=Pseudozyma flocculosa TaxID=84751 RepID=A0A5C3F3D2_9BASI|nr:uncharacterized protein PFL1_03208 [Pseudozyma flocculosa PF-1]EPQ29453.1 hypothetical protein PFL1_03208 [Pseudozyma flocculosa PF-1]SPO37979.1 uncharacterized protein PSFLO_03456 [Pseudozyma flocculosa]
MSDVALTIGLKLGLWVGARALLPFLFGQARHASLDQPPPPSTASSLPQPATSSLSTSSSRHSVHDMDPYSDGDGDIYNSSVADSSSTPFLARTTSKTLRDRVGTLLRSLRLTRNGAFDLHNCSAFLFSLAFEETATLYVAVLLEAAGFDTSDGSTLRGAFRASVMLVVQLAIVWIPLGICLLLTYRSDSSTPLSRRLVYLSLPFIPWLVLFFSVPLPSALSSPQKRSGILDSLVARTAVIGVTLIAVLSGSAAMAATWEAVEQWRGKSIRPPTQSDINLAHDSYDRARSDLEAKRNELQRLEKEVEVARAEGSGGAASRWSLSGLWSGDARSREIKTLKAEIFGLTAIASAMRDDLDTMAELSKRDRRSRTVPGRLLTAIGWVWALYCAFRIVLSLLNLVILGYRDTAPPDFISLALASVLRWFDVDVDVAAWTRQISLVFVGVLIWARIGSVLSYLGRAFRAASASRGVETCFLVLFLSEVMTIYLLATLIQLRTSLPPSLSSSPIPPPPPPPPSSIIPSSSPSTRPTMTTTATTPPPLLATLPSFQIVFGSLFDSSFLVAAVATAAYLYYLASTRSHIGSGGVLFGAGVR